MSRSMMPACMVARTARWCFLATLTPSTITMFRLGMTRMISPTSSLSLPVRTLTRSPFFNFMSQNLGCE